MDESEKRGRRAVARRQQQHNTDSSSPATNFSQQTKNPQHRPRRKMSDFMMGVATGMSARNNNAATSSSAVLPTHFDFSYRDKKDATAKRRFQVKVPYRLMVILALVFLFIPGMMFVHKELHIHDDYYVNHHKTEKYVNVNTKEVWDNFRVATTTDDIDIVQHGVTGNVTGNTTTSQQQQTIREDHSFNVTSDLYNYTVAKSVVVTNQTNPLMDQYRSGEEFTEGVMSGDTSHYHNSAHGDESSLEANSTSLDQENHDITAPPVDSSTTLPPESDNKVIGDNSDENENMGTPANSTAANKIPNGR